MFPYYLIGLFHKTLFEWERLKSFGKTFLALVGSITTLYLFYSKIYKLVTTTEEVTVGNFIGGHWVLGLILLLILSVIKNRPKTVIKRKIRNTDIQVRIQVCDLLGRKGAIIVPWDNSFISDQNSPFIAAETLQGKVIRKYLTAEVSDIRSQIRQFLKNHKIAPLESDQHEETVLYPLGTVVPINCNSGKRFLLAALTDLHSLERQKADLIVLLANVWQSAKTHGDRQSQISVPVIGAGKNRWPAKVTRQIIIQEIVNSFIVASKEEQFCDILTICVHWPLYRHLSFTGLESFLDNACANWDTSWYEVIGGARPLP